MGICSTAGICLITEMTDETKPVTRQSVAKVVSQNVKTSGYRY